MRFCEVPGHSIVKSQLIRHVNEGRVSHAQLFLGPGGCGSLALAVAYAQYICCENRLENDSCGECSSCRKYQKLIHPDLHFSYPFFAKHKDDSATSFLAEWRKAFLANPFLDLDEWRDCLDAENKQANINIAECHQIIQKLSLKPFESRFKVLIMWLPEYLEKEGNTLLKIIEEPPENTLFILVAQNQDLVLNTILSRTQLVKISRFSDDEIINELVKNYGTDPRRAAQVAYLSDGSLQAAIRELGDDPGSNFSLLTKWLRMCATNKGADILDFAEVAARLGRENQKSLLKYAMKLLRESIMLLSGAPDLVHLVSEEQEFINNFSKVMTLAKAEAMVAELERSHYHIERNANPKILFLDVSLLFVKILKFNTIPKGAHYIY